MALIVSNLKPAKIGAGEIVTTSVLSSAIDGYDPATVINSGVTTINGGSITTDSITANRIAFNTLTSNRIAANTTVAANIAGGTITGDKIAAGTITAGNIAATTITGDKLVAGTVTADKINTTGLIAENISATTIEGKTIIGGTLNIGSIAVTNADDRPTAGVFYVDWPISSSMVSGYINVTMTSNLYTYNSTSTSKFRLKNNTSSNTTFDFPYPQVPSVAGGIYAQQLCYSSDSLSNITVTIKAGTVVFAQKLPATIWTKNVWYELGGFGFMHYEDTFNERLLLRLSNPAITVSGTAADAAISIFISAYPASGTTAYLQTGAICRTFISNL